MTDWGASGRIDTFSLHEVDPFSLQETGNVIDSVDGEGSITWGTGTDNICSATLKVHGKVNRGKLIRVKHAINFPDGSSFGETLATLFIDQVTTKTTYGDYVLDLDCFSTLVRYTDDQTVQDFVRDIGTPVIDEVTYIVTVDGGHLRVLPGVDKTRKHTVPIWFPAGTNRAQLLNTLAGWTGNELGVDENGYVTWGPFQPYAARPVMYTFEDGANCTYLSGVDVTSTSSKAVNRVAARFSRETKDDSDPYPLSDFAHVDLPASYPYSNQRIGRIKAHDLGNVDPCTHDELVAQCERYLYQNYGAVSYYEFQHVGIPGLKPGQRVRYVNSTDFPEPIDVTGIIEEISMSLNPGCMCKTKIRVDSPVEAQVL